MLWEITEHFFFIGISLLKQDGLLFVEAVWSALWPLSVRVHLDVQTFKMSFMGKQQWDSMMNSSSLGYTLHGGSVPNLLPPPCSEGLGTLKKRLSMDILRGWAPDLGSLSMGRNLNLSPVKWPSLVTVCKWKQTLTMKLKKRHFSAEDESQVRGFGEWLTSLCWKFLIIYFIFQAFIAAFSQAF